MSPKRPDGICHICGNYGPLSFEHVPPRTAFNNRRFVEVKFEEAFALGPDSIPKGRIKQGGIGYYSLCERCNNLTGTWYGNQFIDWCYQAVHLLIRSDGKPSLYYPYYLLPLRVLKQIVAMFFSVNTEKFREPNEELVRFVLNKESKYLSPKYRFFAYYNVIGKSRFASGTAVLDVNTGKSSVFTEIAYPPFGYLMTVDSEPPDTRLFEISHFSHYSYNEFALLQLRLPVLPTHLVFPGDYRDKDQIQQTINNNIRQQAHVD